jgi:WD40 repeat protein
MKIIIISISLFIASFGIVNAQNYYGSSDSNVFDFSIDNSGALIAIPFSLKIQLWTVENPKLVSEFNEVHKKTIYTIDFSNSEKQIVSGGKDSLLVIWSVVNLKPDLVIKPHQGIILSAKFSPDDKLIVSGATDNDVIVSNSQTGETIKVLKGHTDDVLDVDFIDNNTIASCGADGLIIIWDLQTGKKLNQWSAHDNWTRNISISKDKTQILSCGNDGRIKLWDISNLEKVKLKEDKKISHNWLTSVAFNDNSSYAYAGQGRKIEIFTLFGKYSWNSKYYINKLGFVPDKKYMQLVVATYGGGIFQLDAREKKLKK